MTSSVVKHVDFALTLILVAYLGVLFSCLLFHAIIFLQKLHQMENSTLLLLMSSHMKCSGVKKKIKLCILGVRDLT